MRSVKLQVFAREEMNTQLFSVTSNVNFRQLLIMAFLGVVSACSDEVNT